MANVHIVIVVMAIFCSMAAMIYKVKLDTLLSVIQWVGLIYLADVVMLVVYGLMMGTFGRLNPITFLKKVFPVMINAFSLPLGATI